MKPYLPAALATVAFILALAPADASGQKQRSLGAGIAAPTGTFGDLYDTGFTLRGQTGAAVGMVEVHIQTGWTRFGGKEVTIGTVTETLDDISVFHAGLGARLGSGMFWVGANTAYFWGDLDNGFGFFPEVGLGLGPLEVVADYRIDGDVNWFGLRGGLRF